MRCAIVFICAGIASGALVSDVGFALKSSANGVIVFALLSLGARALDLWLLIQRLLICLLLFLFGLFWHLHWASNILAERLPQEPDAAACSLPRSAAVDFRTSHGTGEIS
jgi:hypothetical protein